METEPAIAKEPEVVSKVAEEQKWSTSLTSLKAKVRQKMETKNYQKDRRNKFLTEIDAISNHSLNQEECFKCISYAAYSLHDISFKGTLFREEFSSYV